MKRCLILGVILLGLTAWNEAQAETYTWPPISPEDPLGVQIEDVRGSVLIVQRSESPRPNRRPIPKTIRLASDVRIEGLPPGRSLRAALPLLADILEARTTGPDEIEVVRLRVRKTSLDREQ